MPPPKSLVYASGDTIIQEGDDADCVYTLKQGRAAAYQRGIKVGDIYPGEIFGALAAFCDLQRNATVKAITLCRVEALSREAFTDLVYREPDLCAKLMKDMARLIDDLNESLCQLTSASSGTPH